MGDLISRQGVLDWLEAEWDGMVWSLFDGIRTLPSVQPQTLSSAHKPRMTGKWRVYEVANCEGEPPIAWECPNCEEVVDTKWKFCPMCGLEMEG